MTARQAGPLLENVWKLEKACDGVAKVSEFIQKYTTAIHQLVYVTFDKGTLGDTRAPGAAGDVWNWKPLLHTEGKVFTMPLRWRLGDAIGVLTVQCGSFTEMNEELVVLLKVCSMARRRRHTHVTHTPRHAYTYPHAALPSTQSRLTYTHTRARTHTFFPLTCLLCVVRGTGDGARARRGHRRNRGAHSGRRRAHRHDGRRAVRLRKVPHEE